jgi:hypothetical protein
VDYNLKSPKNYSKKIINLEWSITKDKHVDPIHDFPDDEILSLILIKISFEIVHKLHFTKNEHF